MNGNALQIVSRALQDLLEAAFVRQSIQGGVYVGPLDDSDANGRAAVLFLYRIVVNAELRNEPHVVPAANDPGVPVRLAGALPLDLFYLLTGGNMQTGGERDAGLVALGYAMQALNDTPNLVGLQVQGETIRVSVDSVTSEEMSRIWALYPTINYRTSVVYRVSPVWIDPSALAIPAPPVTNQTGNVSPAVAEGASV